MNSLFNHAPHRFDPADPPENLDQLVRAAIEEGNRQFQVRKRVSMRKAVVAGLAAALCLSVTALAAGGTLGRIFSGLFGDAHQEITDQIATPASQSVSSAGVTVTADAAMTDGSIIAVALTARRDDGLPFENGLAWDYDISRMDCSTVQNWNGSRSLTRQADGSLRIYSTFQTDSTGPITAFTYGFTGLGVEGKAALSETRYEGEWNFRFQDLKNADTLSVLSEQPVTGAYGTVNTASFTLSPIGARVALDGVFQLDDVSDEEPSGVQPPRVSLVLTNGTVVDLTYGGGSQSPERIERFLAFSEIIPLDHMDYVQIDGVKLPVRA